MLRIITLVIVSLFVSGCAPTKQAIISDEGNDEVLYVLPDGTMEFKGRVLNSNDVVIYNSGRGGERAAVKLELPRYTHAWRDTIEVERVEFDVPIARQSGQDQSTTF